MKRIDLTGEWTFQELGESTWHKAHVPGCVHTDLMNAGLIPDPYYRDNENDLQWIGETDWIYSRAFDVSEEFLDHEAILLCFKNLDTLAEVRLNGVLIGNANNQFRQWEFNVSEYLRVGENELQIKFVSALNYGKGRLEERYIHSWSTDSHKLPGGNYVRKSQCNFGWDWGPKLVTCGIQEDAFLLGFNTARIDDVHILQQHQNATAGLEILVSAELVKDSSLTAKIEISFKEEPVASSVIPLENGQGRAVLSIPGPHLWWPNGLGAQPLYKVVVKLKHADEILDESTKMIGLRDLKLVRKQDEWGESFHFECNGVPFFAKGSNWIPADTFISRVTDSDYERLLTAARDSNQNMLRVWGGGIYEKDIFYELCDRLGITIWQDFMFACATYPSFDDGFMENVKEEAGHQIKRLHHHPCLALWCGNNEMEQGLVGETWTDTQMSWEDYSKLYDQMLSSRVNDLDPQTDYWPGSPHSPHGDRMDFNNPQWGDAHLWNVWHGLAPFEYYRTCTHRFVSEFGFQSFPEPRSLHAFTIESDFSINSPIMEHHQRSESGNARIIHYMLDWFRLPTSFDHQVILSQILQGMAIKYSVDHWRRMMPRSMGTIYWQLNDCWPVASWSSIDYYGRWKALHYMACKFFAPLHLVGIEDWDNGKVDVYLLNDFQDGGKAEIGWQLVECSSGSPITSGKLSVDYQGVSSTVVRSLDFKPELDQYGRNRILLNLFLIKDGEQIADNLILFCRPKQLDLQDPEISWQTNDGQLIIKAHKPALWAWIWLDSDLPLSDNFFHLLPGEEKVISLPEDWDQKNTADAIKISSLWDTYNR